ncbi:MAG: MFS transporter [Anaerolineales bacterium]
MTLRDIPKNLLWLTLTMVIANTSTWMYMPFLPLYLKALGASIPEVGLFYTLNAIIAICFRILGGWISDNIGRLRAVAFGSFAGLLGMFGFILAPTWEWVLLVAGVRQIGVSLVAPSFRAYTAENAPEGFMNSTFGLVQALFLVCNVIGPILGGLLIESMGFRAMFIIATVIFIVATAIRVWLARYETAERHPLGVGELVRDVRGLGAMFLSSSILLWIFLADGLIDASRQLERSFGPVYITDVGGISESTYGLFVSVAALAAALAMVPGGRFSDRFSERWGIVVGVFLQGAVWLMMTVAPVWAVFALMYGLAGVARAFFEPAFSALISKSVPRESLGMTWGVFMTVLSVLAVPAPYLGGLMYDYIAPQATTVFIALIAWFVIPVALWKLYTPRQPAQVPAAHRRTSQTQPAPGAD